MASVTLAFMVGNLLLSMDKSYKSHHSKVRLNHGCGFVANAMETEALLGDHVTIARVRLQQCEMQQNAHKRREEKKRELFGPVAAPLEIDRRASLSYEAYFNAKSL